MSATSPSGSDKVGRSGKRGHVLSLTRIQVSPNTREAWTKNTTSSPRAKTPGSTRQETVGSPHLESAPYLAVRATDLLRQGMEEESLRHAREVFRDVLDSLRRLALIRRQIERRMLQLVKRFRKAFRFSKVTLYAKSRRKGAPPSGVYWGHLSPLRGKALTPKPGCRRVRYWLIHHPGSPTAQVINRLARRHDRREAYLRFSMEAEKLNVLGRRVSAARGSIKHKLRHWGRPVHDDVFPDFPADVRAGNSPSFTRADLEGAWRLVVKMVRLSHALNMVAYNHNLNPPHPQYSLRFTRDGHNRYGRAFWCRPGLPRYLGQLTDRTMRRLRIPAECRRLLARHEVRRREVTRTRQGYIDAIAYVKRVAAHAVRRAEIDLEEIKRLSVAVVRGQPGMVNVDLPA